MATPWKPRTGQWVKCKLIKPVADAHQTTDGFYVGIYHPAGLSSPAVIVDGKVATPAVLVGETVTIVTKEGHDCVELVTESPGQHKIASVTRHPSEVIDLQPLLDKKDLPPGRIVGEDWEPLP